MAYALYPHQKSAVESIRPGSIIYGGVGSGKTIITLSYYFKYIANGTILEDGSFDNSLMKQTIPLYVITTAYKRDSKDWDLEASRIGIKEINVDSWNNIQKYTKIKGGFFIFDEDRVGGHGAWSKAFIKIARQNQWVLASATPGDTWSDYAAVFIAKGYYKTFGEFNAKHVVFAPHIKFPKILRYVNTDILAKQLQNMTVKIKYKSHIVKHPFLVPVEYNKELYKEIAEKRWDTEIGEPVKNASRLCSLLRKASNNDQAKKEKIREYIRSHKRVIVFYNFDYELEVLRDFSKEFVYGEYNSKKHDPIPEGKSWIYAVQYNAWGEGGNCTTCNCMVFYSMPYSYRSIYQAAGRIDRINSNQTDAYYYAFTSKSPIDNSILAALKKKKTFNEKNFVEATQPF